MSDHLHDETRQNDGRIHEVSGCSSNRNAGEAFPTTAVPFRLVADFVVEADTAAEFLGNPDLEPEERDLFLTVLTTPEMLDRICRLAIVCDLKAYQHGRYFDEVFMGPDPGDILDCLLPYLSGDLRDYWTRLRSENYDRFSTSIDDIFLQFHSSLKKTKIEDVTTGEPIPLWISSTLVPHAA